MDSSSNSPITGNLSDLGQPSGAPQQSAPQPGSTITGNVSEFGPASDDQNNTPATPGAAWAQPAKEVLQGAAQGALSTVSGLDDFARKHGPAWLTNQNLGFGKPADLDHIHEMRGDNTERTTAQKVGYGGETLVEFLMGDAAIKALPTMAVKYEAIAKIMKVLEKSPKLMEALKTGTTPVRAVTKYLAGSGYLPEVARMGVTQGAQTGARTGDPEEAGKDALITAGTGAVLNPVLSGVGKFLSKAGTAADFVGSLGKASDNAPTESGLFGGIADKLNQAKSEIESFFSGTKDAAEGTRDTALADAEATKATDLQTADDKLAGQKDQAVQIAQTRRAEDAATKTRQEKITKAAEAAQKYTQTQLVNGLDHVAGVAPDAEELAGKVNEGINGYEKSAHETYESGLNDEENGVISRLDGQSIPVKESQVSTKAAELLNTPNPADHPAVANMKQSAGDALDASVKQQLTELKNGMIEKTTGEGKEAVKQQIPMKDWTAKDLVDFRQAVRAKAASYMRGDINRRVLGKLMDSIDDTLGTMAEHSGQPEVMSDYADLRKGYKEQRSLLDSNTADKLKLTSPDKALDDVTKYLTSGGNPLAKISTIRKIVGGDTMQDLANSKVAQWKELASQDPQKFVKEFNSLKPELREALFGPEMSTNLQNLVDTYTHSSSYADSYGKSLLGGEKAASAASKKTTQQLVGNTGYGQSQLGGLIGEGIKGAHKAEVDGIASRYDDAVTAAKDAYQAAVDGMKPGQEMSKDMFSGTFMKDLMDGRVNESLLSGQVDAQDILKAKTVLGRDDWQGISDGIFQRAIADSTKDGRFDPEKLMSWWQGIKPETRSALFDMDDPANAAKLKHVMDKVADSASVKKMVKWFGGYPLAAGVATGAGIALGGSLAGHIGEIVGGLSGVSGAAKFIPQTVEWIANHPATWNGLKKASGAAATPVAKMAARVAPAATVNSIKGVYNSLSKPLGR